MATLATPGPDTTTAAYEYRLGIGFRRSDIDNCTTLVFERRRPRVPVAGYRSAPGTPHISVSVRVVEREPRPRAVTPPAPRRPVRRPPSFNEPRRWRARFVSGR